MLDFIIGWLNGRHSVNKKPVELQITDDRPIEEIIEIPKVTKYVPIPDITDFDTTLEGAYKDYDDTQLVTIYKNGHIYYYLEVEVYETDIKWGSTTMVENI